MKDPKDSRSLPMKMEIRDVEKKQNKTKLIRRINFLYFKTVYVDSKNVFVLRSMYGSDFTYKQRREKNFLVKFK